MKISNHSIKKRAALAARSSKEWMCSRSQIAHTDQIECLREVDVATVRPLLVHIDGMLDADLTRRHVYILGSIPIAKDDSAQELRLAYQNISLRQSI